MNRIHAMQAFTRVALSGSFARAAQQLGMANSVVSRLVSDLEKHLKVNLLHRTTRRLTLTQAGEVYLQDCLRILNDLEHMDERVRTDSTQIKGKLRLGVPLSFGVRQLPPIISVLHERFPELQVDLHLLNRNMDPTTLGLDLIIHLWGELPPAAVAKRITQTHNVACAAPAYLEKHGLPRHPCELTSHHCLIPNFNGVRVDNWRFMDRQGDRVNVEVQGWIECNQTSILCDACLAGEGIVFLPTFMLGDEIRQGRLVPLFPDWRLYRMDIHATYLASVHVPTRVRAFIDLAVEIWGDNPPWDEWIDKYPHGETWNTRNAQGVFSRGAPP